MKATKCSPVNVFRETVSRPLCDILVLWAAAGARGMRGHQRLTCDVTGIAALSDWEWKGGDTGGEDDV